MSIVSPYESHLGVSSNTKSSDTASRRRAWVSDLSRTPIYPPYAVGVLWMNCDTTYHVTHYGDARVHQLRPPVVSDGFFAR